MTLTDFRTGQLVICRDLPFGIAKIEHLEGHTAIIHFFESVGKRYEHEVSLHTLSPHTLYPQNRCYVNTGDKVWRVGRLIDLPGRGQRWYGVQFPNGKFEEVPEGDVYVRWAEPVRNPVEVLELHGHETPFWFDRRWPMVQALTTQRAAARGLNALLSSAVELREHQVDVALRVLQDPVQRYLLADEVGLGKTIEAGLIVRQRLLDDPTSRIVVLVPDTLVPQWTAELITKFFLSDFPHANIQILGQGQTSLPDQADLVVVDEAHHLAAQAFGTAAAKERYLRLARLAHAAPRLLLLSATPAATDQRGFLAMLHLLEPDVYRLDDLNGFQRRVAERESIGTLFYSLDEDTPAFLLEDTLTEIRTQFPDDPHLLRLCDRLEAALEDDAARVTVIRAIRVHVSETYRLHRRMLRHRRAGRAGDVVRGRKAAGVLSWSGDRMAGAWAALDEWREELALAVEQQHLAVPDALALLTTLFEASLSPLTLQPVLAARLGDATASRRLNPEQRRAVQVSLFPEEHLLLQAVSNLLPEPSVTPLIDAVTGGELPGKTVIFTMFPALAGAVAADLRLRLGEPAVAQHTAGMTSETQEANVERFRQEAACAFLVVDASAEEGRNLQFADHLVHLDLPLNPNRLEQRLGRIDRYSRGEPVPSHLLLPEPLPGWLESWVGILRDQLQVFDHSIAALQFLVDELRTEMATALLQGRLKEWGVILSERVQQELRRLNRQDVLDTIDLGVSTSLTETMDALYDSEALPFSRIMQNWMIDALHFRVEKEGQCFQISASPEKPTTLVPWERLRDSFQHLNLRTGTFSRAAALKTPDLHLYRLGEPTVDALHAYLNWDDRGQSYAMWRYDDAWKGRRDLLAFRFNYLIEGNLTVLMDDARDLGWDEGALRRRLDALLPPCTHTLWLNHRGSAVPEEATDILARPFGKVRVTFPPEQLDYNLGWERLWALREHLTDADWVRTCREVHQQADTAVQADAGLQEHLHRALNAAQRHLDSTLEQLRTRAARLNTLEAARELALEERLAPLLLQALREPHIRLDSVGFVVLSSRDPFIDEVSGA